MAHTLERVVLALDRDDDFLRCGEGVDSEQAEGRRAVDDHVVVLVDCPPSLGLLTINAFAAAQEVVIPIQCEYYALEGVSQLLQNITLVQSSLNRDLVIGGVVLTMFDGRTNLSADVAAQVREFFGDATYRTVIPRSVRLSEAPSYGEPIEAFDPMSRGAIAYRYLGEEYLGRHGGGAE